MKFSTGVVARYVLLALVNALGIYGLIALAEAEMWEGFAAMLVGVVGVDIVYATKRFVPMKYLVPGLIFLLVYQVYVIAYTVNLSFTNYSEFASGSQEDSVATILAQNERRVPDSPQYALSVLEKDGELAFLVTDPQGEVLLGDEDDPLEPVDDAQLDGAGKAVGYEGYSTLDLAALSQRQQEVLDFRVPRSDDPTEGSLKTQDGINAYVFTPTATYDAATDTITKDGVVYTANDDTGYFTSESGEELTPGWRVYVGFENYVEVLQNTDIRGPFLQVFGWTLAFAFLSVVTCFVLGLTTALVLNDPRLRGKRLYRSLLILPYAIPAFISAGVFRGMLNTEFGWFNQVLFFGAEIDWLGDPWLAKFSLIMVNLWLGYPYMFLVATGAIQAIPNDTVEAARVDGASSWNVFYHVKFPVILVATAPLLIASFAFNFNNFNLVRILTDGGPPISDAAISVGHTDILVTFIFDLAFGGDQALYGFAAAISILNFLIVGVLAVIGFMQTKRLEEMS